MVGINKIQAIAALNKEMLDAVYKLEEVMKNKDKKQLAEAKELILNLQKKTSELLK